MVKLVFNPKKGNNEHIGVSKTTKNNNDITQLFSKLSLTFEKVEKIEKVEKSSISTKDLIGLENTLFVFNEWYKKSLTDPSKSLLLLIGPTGCGKTSLVELYCKENDILLFSIKMNDSVKTKKELLREITVFVEYSSTSFFIKDSIKPNKLILLDEYQNGQNDLLGITDILSLLELKSKGKLCPIVIISADPKGSKLSDLKKNNEVYYISDIPQNVIKNWVSKEFPNFDQKQIDFLVKKCKNDKRLLINSLNYLSKSNVNDIEKYINTFYKDSDANIFEFTNQLFDSTEKTEISEIYKIYENDGFLLSWLVQENYLDFNDNIDSIARSADSISLAETVYSDTYESNRNFLPDYHCLLGLVIPSFYSKDFYKKNKCQLRTSCINNRYNIFLNNQKLFKKIGLDPLETLFLKKFINQDLVKAKTLSENQIGYLKNIFNCFSENQIEKLELIYKHFSDFREISGKEPKTKNFTLKFKEKLNKLK